MKHWLLAVLVLFLACGPKERALPDGVLDRTKFTEVLTDMQLLEARMNRELVVAPQGEVPMGAYYEELFDRAGITRETFEKSFVFYAEDPGLLRSIYDDVIAELGRRKDQAVSGPVPH